MNKQHGLNTLALFAVRYALPRQTSADFATISALKHWWPDISERVQKQVISEINDEKDIHHDNPWLWNDFLKWIDEHGN